MKRIISLLLLGFGAASLLGWFGQDIAYFLNDTFSTENPFVYLIITTILSIFLYVIVGLMLIKMYRAGKLRGAVNYLLTFSGFAVAFYVTSISTFILMMWWE